MSSTAGSDSQIGIELFGTSEEVVALSRTSSDGYSDVARHRVARGATVVGEAAVRMSGKIIGKTVAELIDQVVAEVDDGRDPGDADALRLSTLQLTFGVKITTGAGKAIEAFVTANGEASVQVVATFTRG
ncbi:hypothetical protein LTT66_33580 [Nocardia gipuzkoensis]|uniref:hypothetical protein n=1 Tax=Nocardia gipuzkoensis TaxID=2749991 RepID=UPI001E60C8BA|nr:hypothetical protein [Nocardia gipuzkoensis]UGT68040.1 hypothetical protein LTT66_33580 [Nocardia gipuzkoensis]